MNQNEAFTDEPPIIEGVPMRPFSGRVANIISQYVLSQEGAGDLTSIGAYVLISGMESREALAILRRENAVIECDARALDLSEDDFAAINTYLGRVLDRRAAAAIEIPESPGKPEDSAATQPTK
jgi:hypothetical protein